MKPRSRCHAIAQEDNERAVDNHLYAIHGTYDVNKRMQVGATLGRYVYADDSGQNTTNGAVDAAYKFKKSTFTSELAKSNADKDNKAYAVTWNYAFNDKTAVYVTAFRVEPYADMGQQSDFDNNVGRLNEALRRGFTRPGSNKKYSFKKQS